MKSIIEYQEEYWLKKSMITEAFKAKIMQDIAKQLNNRIEANHKYNSENKSGNRDTDSTFKHIFNGEWVKWSDLEDNDFKEYTKSDKEGVKQAKAIMSNRQNSFPGAIVLLGDEEDDPKYLGMMLSTGWSNNYVSFISNSNLRLDSIKPGEVEGFLTNRFMIINLNGKLSGDLKNERTKAKNGALNPFNTKEGREWEYKRIAEKNLERYKQYAAKVKAEKDINDGLAEKVDEYVHKIMDITIKMSKNPVKYAKFEYDVRYLLDLLNDKVRWVKDTKYNGHYSGKDGLLILYKNYMEKKLSLAKGDSYSSEREDYEKYKKALEQMFLDIDEKLKKFAEVE